MDAGFVLNVGVCASTHSMFQSIWCAHTSHIEPRSQMDVAGWKRSHWEVGCSDRKGRSSTLRFVAQLSTTKLKHWPVYWCNAAFVNRKSMFPGQRTLNMQTSNVVSRQVTWKDLFLHRSHLEKWWKVRTSKKAAARKKKSSQSSGAISGAAGRWAAHHCESSGQCSALRQLYDWIGKQKNNKLALIFIFCIYLWFCSNSVVLCLGCRMF